MNKDYFCIFAGGGVRGASYLGVLKSFEEMNINITGLAGSSAGAIFAALYAVGYTYEEMKEILFKINFEIFKDICLPFDKNFTDFGIFKGEHFLEWFKQLLAQKFYGKKYKFKKDMPVRFRDINKDLIIMATNLSEGKYKEFSKYTTPDEEIAHAVRASISLPGFFKPVLDNNCYLIDGDVIKNFPLWSFSKDMLYDHQQILEFRLEGDKVKNINNPIEYFNAMLDASYNISTDLLIHQYAENHQFDFVVINTGLVKTTDFHISIEQKEELINRGYNYSKQFFEKNIIKKSKKLLKTYEIMKKSTNLLHTQLKNNKIKDANITMADIAINLAENKEFIHKKVYYKMLNLRKMFVDNVFLTKFFNGRSLRKKEAIIIKLEQIINMLDYYISELS